MRKNDAAQITAAMASAAHARLCAEGGTEWPARDWLELGDHYENLAREAQGIPLLPVRVSDIQF